MKTIKSKIAPNPKEAQEWIDLTADAHGAVKKYWNGHKWVASNENGVYDTFIFRLETAEKTIESLQNVITDLNKTLVAVISRVSKLEKSVTME